MPVGGSILVHALSQGPFSRWRSGWRRMAAAMACAPAPVVLRAASLDARRLPARAGEQALRGRMLRLHALGGEIAGRTGVAANALATNAYVASCIDLALEAEALHTRADAACIAETAIGELVAAVVMETTPVATASGRRLLYDARSGAEAVCWSDRRRLRKVVAHLILRAMANDPGGAFVRIAITLSRSEAWVSVLTPVGAEGADTREAGLLKFAAVQSVLQAMHASLVIEPIRAGWLPLSVSLRRNVALPVRAPRPAA